MIINVNPLISVAVETQLVTDGTVHKRGLYYKVSTKAKTGGVEIIGYGDTIEIAALHFSDQFLVYMSHTPGEAKQTYSNEAPKQAKVRESATGRSLVFEAPQ
jgi:hypothetical protein